MALFFKAERALQEGYRAWHRGDLDAALEQFETALKRSRRAPEVLYPLARVLSERNEYEKGLALLEDAHTREQASAVGGLFRGILRYDHDEKGKAQEDLTQLAGENILARSLLALLDFKDQDQRSISIPRAARWLAEVAGRLLAILEERLYRMDVQAASHFHHALFSPAAVGKKSSDIEEAFLNEQHEKVASLGCNQPGKLADSDRIYCAFSLIAVGDDKKARQLLEAMGKEAASADIHFLEGLCHSRFGRSREAGWSFVRAARLADIEVDHVLTELTEKLGVGIQLE